MSNNLVEELPAGLATADNLPSIPSVALQVLQLAKDDNAGIDEFADAISLDPALSAKLLKLSNSSVFSMNTDVSTLQQATMVLGLKTVQLMSLSFSLASALPQSGSVGAFEFTEYWRRSLITSVAGRALCKLLNCSLADEAFTCGLLAQLGQLVMAQAMTEDYAKVMEKATDWPTAELEAKLLGFDHALVGGTILRSWDLPGVIADVVQFTSNPAGLPDDAAADVRQLSWIMHMALLTSRVMRDEDKGTPLSQLTRLAAERGIAEATLEAFLLDLESSLNETAELLDLKTDDDGPDHAEVIAEARNQTMRISLGTAATLQTVERRAESLEAENRTLATKATTDKLTGIANRAGFDEMMEESVQMRTGAKLPNALGMLLLDIDKFKVFNDTYGHQAGDKVLRIVGSVMKKLTRETDLPARYGGEEFAVIVPQTNPFALKSYAERIRKTIASVPIALDGATVHVTVSIGGACLVRAAGPGDVMKLIEAADQELYGCKDAGRNCSAIAKDLLNAPETE